MNKVAARLKRRAAAEKNPVSTTAKALLAGAKEIEILEKKVGPRSLRAWMVGMDTLIEELNRKVESLERTKGYQADAIDKLQRRYDVVANVLNKR